MPYVGTSIVLIAIGGILAFAVTAHVQGFNIQVAGWILMIVGGIALLLSLVWQLLLTDRARARRRALPPE